MRQPSSVSRLENVDCTADSHIGKRPTQRPHGTEARLRPLRGREHRDVDLGLEDLLQAPHVGVPVLGVRIGERTRPLEARRRVDDLLAVNLAAPALRLVLRMQWERRRRGLLVHSHIVGTNEGLRKT